MLALLAPVLVFGLVIFVHEFGHFLAAKAMGVYAPRFSIGFGPALWRRRRGETEYVLAILPLGGYVRMASRHDESSAFLEGGNEEQSGLKPGDPGFDPEAMMPFGPKPVPEHRWFESKPLPARLFILLAGVSMNAVLAVVVAVGLAFHFGRTVVPTRVVGAVHVPAGGAALAALQPGDTIFRVNGDRVRDWSDVLRGISLSRTQVDFGTQHGDVVVPLSDSLTPLAVANAVDYWIAPVVDSVLPGGAAAEAGLQKGDSVAAIDGRPMLGFADLVARVSGAADRPLVFSISRRGKPLEVRVTPRPTPVTDPVTGKVDTLGRIGVAQREDVRRVSLSFAQAVSSGTNATWIMGGAVIGTVRDLITRKVSVKELGGPIAITRASVQAARSGMETLFYLIALLSINVAVLNLLPIPILDGGQILMNVIE
ncbi:MAG TPA: RIP metalloprotease RseP, partial [Gemmatimonadaceae bacterium]|nr:RIP metalloprotease RseP [Gemmatimonadaceae bacterium]